MWTAFVRERFWFEGSGTWTGQYSKQVVQPVQMSSLTYRGFLFSVTVKPPASPSTRTTSVLVRISMFGCRLHSMNFGDSMHIEQSLVGKVLSGCDIFPPMAGDLSTRNPLTPVPARSSAVWMAVL